MAPAVPVFAGKPLLQGLLRSQLQLRVESGHPRPAAFDLLRPLTHYLHLTRFLGFTCSVYQSIQPVLVAVDHRIGLSVGQFQGRLTFLGFLGEDSHSTLRQIFNEPCMVHVQSCIAFAGPTMPGNPAWRA